MGMKVTVNIERIQPNTSVGEGVRISYTYTDFDKSVIDCVEEGLRAAIEADKEVLDAVNN